MKKITAIICSVIVSCTMFVSCGDESSSSKAETSAAATEASSTAEETSSAAEEASSAAEVSSETAGDDTTDSQSEPSNSDSTYAAAYTEKLKSGNFAIDMTSESEYMGEFTIKVEASGENFHMYMNLGEYGSTDSYYIDGKMYALEEDTKTYMVVDMDVEDTDSEDIASSSFGLADNYEFVSSEETDDGMICETYSFVDEMLDIDSEAEVEPSTIKYYFENSTGDIKKIEVTEMGMFQTVTINSFVIGDVEIVLPDLSDWTETDMSSIFGDEDIDFSDENLLE